MTQRPTKSSTPLRMLTPVFIVLALACAWSIYWWFASGVAQERSQMERRRLEALGYGLSCNGESWGGYPFRFEFSCDSPVISIHNREVLSASDLAVVALAYKPWHWLALMDGPTKLSFSAAAAHEISHGRIIASVEIDQDGLEAASVELPDLLSPGIGAGKKTVLHLRTRTDGAYDVAATVEDLSIVTLSPDPLPIDRGSLLGLLESGNRLKIEKALLTRKNVEYWGSGEVALDLTGVPEGTLSTATNDLDGLLEILEPHLPMSQQEKANLRLALGLLGNDAKIEIMARAGELYVGPFKVAVFHGLY